MKIAIMQPYLFPYIGYFQLINAVDKFLIHDDVQYSKGGWVNRNRILLQGKAHMYTFSLEGASDYLDINERNFSQDIINKESKKFLTILKHAYKKAPYFPQVSKLVEKCLLFDELNIAKKITYTLKVICDYIGVETVFYMSSDLDKDSSLSGEDRVIDLNKVMCSDHYINPIGGIELYNKESFAKEGIKLNFLSTKPIRYEQFENEFIPNLSIIDVMMFNSKDQIKKLLTKYELI